MERLELDVSVLLADMGHAPSLHVSSVMSTVTM